MFDISIESSTIKDGLVSEFCVIHLQYFRLNRCNKESPIEVKYVKYSENSYNSVFSLMITRKRENQLNQKRYFILFFLVVWTEI